MPDSFTPVMDAYAPRVIATYLSVAFNGSAVEVPPARSPVWPLAVRMVELMRRDRYALGAYHGSLLRGEPATPLALPNPAPYRAVAVQRSASYGHATAALTRSAKSY